MSIRWPEFEDQFLRDVVAELKRTQRSMKYTSDFDLYSGIDTDALGIDEGLQLQFRPVGHPAKPEILFTILGRNAWQVEISDARKKAKGRPLLRARLEQATATPELLVSTIKWIVQHLILLGPDTPRDQAEYVLAQIRRRWLTQQ